MIREAIRNDLMVYLHDIGCERGHKPITDKCPYFDLRPASLPNLAEEVAMHMHDALCDEDHEYSFHANDIDNVWQGAARQIVLEIAAEAQKKYA